MKSLFFALMVVVVSLSSTRAQTEIGCFVAGECLDSLYIAIAVRDTDADCLNFCKETAGCQYWTHYHSDKACFSFVECTNLSVATCQTLGDCISGDKECIEAQCDLAGQCDGGLVSFSTTATRDDCLQLCKDAPTCAWYTFDTSNNYCTLSSDCAYLDTNCATCVAGEKDCELGSGPVDPGSKETHNRQNAQESSHF